LVPSDSKWKLDPVSQTHLPTETSRRITATKPNEYWHVDTTIVRLLDGSRLYLHAILDNFSRRVLAWRLIDTFETDTTAELLKEASKGLPENKVIARDRSAEFSKS